MNRSKRRSRSPKRRSRAPKRRSRVPKRRSRVPERRSKSPKYSKGRGTKLVSVKKSPRPGKKYMATFKTANGRTKTVHFGATGYSDYTKHKSPERKQRYITRHKKDLKGDPTKPGYLSYYILWGPSTSLQRNIASYKRKFHL